MELLDTVVVSTRIRLARNFAEYPFPHRLTDPAAVHTMIRTVYEALSRLDDFTLYRLDEMPEGTAERFMENYIISPALLARKKIAAVAVNADENVSVMINEEDHLREQRFSKGYDLWGCYEALSGIDDALSKSLDFAYDDRFGYLTACATNAGTGLRSSVMLFLPALTENGLVDSVAEKIANLGFVLRGGYGEGTEALGCLYQLSNEVTLGTSEERLLTEVNNVVLKIAQFEGAERKTLFAAEAARVRDRALRAYGVLTNCALLSYRELMRFASDLKLGVALGILSAENFSLIDDLCVAMRPTNLKKRVGLSLAALEEDACRAQYTENTLKKIVTRTE